MILGIMQPYFFPYLGYFELINYSDKWIIFDKIQYIRRGWVNRNRILHPTSGWQYIVAPLQKHQRNDLISDVQVQEGTQWKEKILAQLEHYKKKAPYYDQTIEFLRSCFQSEERSLARLNGQFLAEVCQLLTIPFEIVYFSDMNLELGTIDQPGDWALRISQQLGADQYVNPPGGREIFDPQKFSDSNILLNIREFTNWKYSIRGYEFEPALSVIDVLMWNSPTEIKSYLDQQLDS